MEASKNIEFVLSETFRGVEILILSTSPITHKITHTISHTDGFKKINDNLSGYMEELEAGKLLYSGSLDIRQLLSTLVNLGFRCGIMPKKEPKTVEEKKANLQKQLMFYVENECFQKAHELKQKIDSLV